MKASVCTKYGSPDVLQLKEVDKPVANNDELLIKIFATTVNRTDTATLRAIPFIARLITGLLRPKKSVLGSEYAGQVETVGKNVTAFKVGDRVFGLNEDSFGSHAQYMTVNESEPLAIIPEHISYKQATACIEGAYYAYNFINKVQLEAGQKVLVNGGTGGIGSAAIQLLKYFNTEITATCSTKNIALVKSLGATKIIDYTTEDFTKSSQKCKYHYVFDCVAKSSFGKCKPLLLPNGVYISSDLGYMAQNLFLPLITKFIGSKKVKFPMPENCKEIVGFIKERMTKGSFKAVIDREYSLEHIVDAYKYVEEGQKIGNVVITVNHNDELVQG